MVLRMKKEFFAYFAKSGSPVTTILLALPLIATPHTSHADSYSISNFFFTRYQDAAQHEGGRQIMWDIDKELLTQSIGQLGELEKIIIRYTVQIEDYSIRMQSYDPDWFSRTSATLYWNYRPDLQFTVEGNSQIVGEPSFSGIYINSIHNGVDECWFTDGAINGSTLTLSDQDGYLQLDATLASIPPPRLNVWVPNNLRSRWSNHVWNGTYTYNHVQEGLPTDNPEWSWSMNVLDPYSYFHETTGDNSYITDWEIDIKWAVWYSATFFYEPYVEPPPPAVPEPATFALFGAGLLGLAAAKRKRKFGTKRAGKSLDCA